MFKKEKESAPAQETGEALKNDAAPKAANGRGKTILDLIMRIFAMIGTLSSAIAVGRTGQTLPHFSGFLQFSAAYTNLPTFTFFVVANAIASAYLVLSLVLSIFHILKTGAKVTRAVLIILDLVILALLISGASAATAIVYLAHNGNPQVNWFAICQEYNAFCERVSGALVGSFLAILVLMLLISLSAVSLSKI
ncbi:casparian strip membrane protein 1-like [Primulina tabacum]|uniref:casparian strip membrane protein 1-like n=1 Tax=Primulina tabacum TaxID=48773 RepID=UPI003F59AAB3